MDHAGMQEAPLVGDHLALDLLNTEARQDGAPVDYWQSGDDVLAWLARHGVAMPAAAVDADALLARARALRTLARRLVGMHHQAHKQAHEDVHNDVDKYVHNGVHKGVDKDVHKHATQHDIEALNAILDGCLSAPRLEPDGEGRLVLRRVARGDAFASLLGPVAQALAELLADGDFALVKQCEHPDCVLWFYDRTKAHRRRWCSMSTCGNRYKAAQFRKKGAAAQA